MSSKTNPLLRSDDRGREEKLLAALTLMADLVATLGWGGKNHNVGFKVKETIETLHKECRDEANDLPNVVENLQREVYRLRRSERRLVDAAEALIDRYNMAETNEANGKRWSELAEACLHSSAKQSPQVK